MRDNERFHVLVRNALAFHHEPSNWRHREAAPRRSVIEQAKQWQPFISPKWSPFVPPAVAINPWHVGKVFITPKGKGKKWHAEYGCSGAVMPVARGGLEVRCRDPCSKCVPNQVV